jgi:phage shock protein C
MGNPNIKRRLYRSQSDKMIAGVCGGLAEYFNIDPVIIRILFVVLTIGPGVGILAYIILWIVVPKSVLIMPSTAKSAEASNSEIKNSEDKNEESNNSTVTAGNDNYVEKERRNGNIIFALILVFIGIIWFIHNVIPGFEFKHLFPILLIGIGLLIILGSLRKS